MRAPFSPPPGLNSDDTTFSAEGRWADGNNVRFRFGKPQVIGGWNNTYTNVTLPANFGNYRFNAIAWSAESTGTLHIAFASATGNARVLRAGVLHNIGTISQGSGAKHTNLALWGEQLLVRSDGGGIYHWDLNTANNVALIANAPAGCFDMIVTPQRQIMVFNCVPVAGAGNGDKRCIRWSDLENKDTWTPTASNNAGEHILDCDAEIIGGRNVGGYIGVWTGTELFIGEYVGDPSLTYRFTKVADKCGLHHSRTVTVVDGVAYWMSRDLRFWRWAPGGMPEAIPCPILKDLHDNYEYTTTGGRSFATSVTKFREVWFFYPDARDGANTSRYLALNIDEGTWFRGQMARDCMIDNPVLRNLSTVAETSSILSVGTAGQVYLQELGKSDNGAALSWHIQSADQYVDEGDREIEVQRYIHDAEDQTGSIKLSVNVRLRPNSTATTKGPYTITTSDTKKDFRATGKIVSVKFEDADATNSYWRIGKPLFDLVLKGRRA